ncbi:MAG: hypothetical protein IKI75_11615 [Lachnospiraceae bacterium]|nr:hypothetical protein [Lachnospiraceae bacterium]
MMAAPPKKKELICSPLTVIATALFFISLGRYGVSKAYPDPFEQTAGQY